MVFQRRSRQAKTVPRFNTADNLGAAAAGVLDRLRFVENEQMIRMARQCIGIAPEQRIGCQDDIMIGDFGKPRFPLGAMQGKYRQPRGKAHLWYVSVSL